MIQVAGSLNSRRPFNGGEMANLSEYITNIDSLVKQYGPLVAADKNLAIGQALKEHSRHKPRVVVEDVPGSGDFSYAVAALSAWCAGFSVITAIEYPVDDESPAKSILGREDYRIYSRPSGDHLIFKNSEIPSGDNFRISYTALHTIGAESCSVAEIDHDAVQALAAAYVCDRLATVYAQSHDGVIQADSVDHSSKSREYASRAAAFRKLYFDHIGAKPGDVKPAGGSTSMPTRPSWNGGRLTERRR